MYLLKVRDDAGAHVENDANIEPGDQFTSGCPWHLKFPQKFVLVQIVKPDSEVAKELPDKMPEPEKKTADSPPLGRDATDEIELAEAAGVRVYKRGRKIYRVLDAETGTELTAKPFDGKPDLDDFLEERIANAETADVEEDDPTEILGNADDEELDDEELDDEELDDEELDDEELDDEELDNE